jgi:riboflavin kinase / FMN adenylyltransferase
MNQRNSFSLIDDPHRLPAHLRGAAVAIGNFDGFHRGHQTVLTALKTWARRHGTPALVLSFEPHPRDFFRRQEPLLRITDGSAKATLAKALGLDGLVILRFDQALSRIEPREFVERFLVDALDCSAIFVGNNFRFGRDRKGDIDLLQQTGQSLGFDCNALSLAADCRDIVSSTRVRAALAAGDIEDANTMLGFRWFFEARTHDTRPDQRRAAFHSDRLAGIADGDYLARGIVGPWPVEGIARIDGRTPGQFDMFFAADMPPASSEPVRLSLLANSQSTTADVGTGALALSELDRAIGII